jgi:hypothetical protein
MVVGAKTERVAKKLVQIENFVFHQTTTHAVGQCQKIDWAALGYHPNRPIDPMQQELSNAVSWRILGFQEGIVSNPPIPEVTKRTMGLIRTPNQGITGQEKTIGPWLTRCR